MQMPKLLIPSRKGQLGDLALGVGTAIVILFIFIYAISKVALVSEGAMYDYTYTTASNATVQNLTTSGASFKTVSTGTFSTSVYGVTPDKNISVTITNQNATHVATIAVLLNGTSLGSFSATNNSVTTHVFTDVDLSASTKYNISTASDLTEQTVWANTTSIIYASSRSTSGTSFGGIYASLVTSTSTIFDVLILVIIVVSLGVAIAVLRGYGQSAGGQLAV